MPHLLNSLESLTFLFINVRTICHNHAINVLLSVIYRVRATLFLLRLSLLNLIPKLLWIKIGIQKCQRIQRRFIDYPRLINHPHIIIALYSVLIETFHLFLFIFNYCLILLLLLIFLSNCLSSPDSLSYFVYLINQCLFFLYTHNSDSLLFLF
jgi:hypothetical protein